MSQPRTRRRSSGATDVLAAEGLEAWQAEPLADALARAFDTEVSERHTRDGKIDVFVSPGKKVPKDEVLLEAFVMGALAMLDEVSEDEEEEDDDLEDEDDEEEEEDERPARRRR